MIGLDTSTIIDLFKGDDNVISFLNNTREQVSTTVINIFELFWGGGPARAWDPLYQHRLRRLACQPR